MFDLEPEREHQSTVLVGYGLPPNWSSYELIFCSTEGTSYGRPVADEPTVVTQTKE